jgi:periplasmic divalent cation tolerance protein
VNADQGAPGEFVEFLGTWMTTLVEESPMLESTSSARIVLTTTANLDAANRLGRILVEERLAACATVIPAVESIYSWKGNLETSSEAMLLLKTGAEQVAALEARLHQLHGYETPEFLVLGVESGSHAYLAWMFSGLGTP